MCSYSQDNNNMKGSNLSRILIALQLWNASAFQPPSNVSPAKHTNSKSFTSTTKILSSSSEGSTPTRTSCTRRRNRRIHALILNSVAPATATETATTTRPAEKNDIATIEAEERHLFESIQNYKDSNKDKPAMEDFIDLIESWLLFPQPKRAEMILDRMEELYTPSGRLIERIINAWSFGSTECIDRLTLTDDDDDSDDEEVKENKAKERKFLRENAMFCSDRAVSLLSRMEHLCEEIGDDFRPALSTYTSVVNSVLRSSEKNPLSFAARRETVERIKERRDRIYNKVDKRLRITSIPEVFATLKYMDNTRINDKLARIHGKPNPIANRYNFNLIINALAQIGEPWAANAAEDILDFMIRRHVNDKNFRPSIESINGCINAWARCTSDSDSASRAEAILEKLNLAQTSGMLKNLVPDKVSYNTLIRANGANAERAESILDTMIELYESTGDSNIKPDIISYSSVLNSFAKAASRDPSASGKSEEILRNMIKMQEEEEDDEICVNTWCFNTVSTVPCTVHALYFAFKNVYIYTHLFRSC